ncbi:MAG: hypothetical protein ACKN82_01670, partial [Pirellula sp.]
MRSALLFVVCLLSGVPSALGQSWLGFNAAVPKVAPGYGSGVSVATPGVATTPIPGVATPSLTSVAPTLVPTTRPWKLGVVVRNTDIGA